MFSEKIADLVDYPTVVKINAENVEIKNKVYKTP
ncbi:hypothetical protein EV214_13533 [Marinisporobacter balticus]|uniref:Uncharacterized protein n=1 Tax=Marinisporobacter balticus TaxID=2018667 RepID=A0A4R2K6Z5_9FIRM|nr:hypothetical protein EV214_13533 [Marinisporobacter balticus]